MPVIRCDQTSCTYRGIECCTASRIEMQDGECVTAVTYEALMKMKPEENKRSNKS
jgi:hypothetical protein